MSTTKVCAKCNVTKTLCQYNKQGKSHHAWCRDCCKEYGKKRYKANPEYYYEKRKKQRKNNQEWFLAFKRTLECEGCGETHPRCLEFHHVTNEKKMEVSNMVAQGYSKKTILAEIAECRVLCANCHRKETFPMDLTDKNHD